MPQEAPKCCGRTMRRDGRQFVCSKCKSWTDSSAVPVVVPALTAGVR
jgi:tRNA(Ile2) C34 agmatinyltransferase TiaS